jgi:hypothetical protein
MKGENIMGITIGEFLEIFISVIKMIMDILGGLNKEEEGTETPEA